MLRYPAPSGYLRITAENIVYTILIAVTRSSSLCSVYALLASSRCTERFAAYQKRQRKPSASHHTTSFPRCYDGCGLVVQCLRKESAPAVVQGRPRCSRPRTSASPRAWPRVLVKQTVAPTRARAFRSARRRAASDEERDGGFSDGSLCLLGGGVKPAVGGRAAVVARV